MNELIKQARELCERGSDEGYDVLSMAPFMESLCDALEAAEKENEEMTIQMQKIVNLVESYEREIVPGFNKLSEMRESEINILTTRAEQAEAELDAVKAELCQCCHAFSDATGHGWNENCEVCKFRPLPEPPKGDRE